MRRNTSLLCLEGLVRLEVEHVAHLHLPPVVSFVMSLGSSEATMTAVVVVVVRLLAGTVVSLRRTRRRPTIVVDIALQAPPRPFLLAEGELPAQHQPVWQLASLHLFLLVEDEPPVQRQQQLLLVEDERYSQNMGSSWFSTSHT